MTLPSHEAFLEALGSSFRVQEVVGLGGPTELVMRSLDDRRAPAGWECFSMLFEGALSSPLQQGNYPMAHERLGALELFVVPIGERAGTKDYEVIIYRPLATSAILR